MQLALVTCVLYKLVLFKSLNRKWIFDYNTLFLIYVEAFSVVNSVHSFLEFPAGKFGFVCQFEVSEWLRWLNDELDEIVSVYPTSGFRIIFLPLIKKLFHYVFSYKTRIELLGIFQALNDSCNWEIHDQPGDYESEREHVELIEGWHTTSPSYSVIFHRYMVVLLREADIMLVIL